MEIFENERLKRLVAVDPSLKARLSQALYPSIIALAKRDKRFYVLLRDNPIEALKEIGISLPGGLEPLIVRPHHQLLKLPPMHGDAREHSRSSLVSLAPQPQDPTDPGDPDDPPPPKKKEHHLIVASITHFADNIVPEGHKGDDVWTVKIPPGHRLGFNYLSGDSSDVCGYRVENMSDDGSNLTVNVHWWFNAYMISGYDLHVNVVDPDHNVAQLPDVFYQLSTTESAVYSQFEGGTLLSSWEHLGPG